ncbi:MAG: dsDNA nuclease domain-containing protein, partial [Cyanobacteria bacterium P01_D01_bin.115]
MTPVSPRPSYRDLPPLERGGEINRNGLEFQDHVAAGYCIDMLSGSSLVEVWCETLDDITLVWCKDDCEEFEFVQAKSNSLNHLWSVAELCKRDKKKGKPSLGSSIFEKLIANERGK